MRTGQGSSRGEEERRKGVRHSTVPTQYTRRKRTLHAHTHRTLANVFIGKSFIHSRRLQRLLIADLCAELAACSGPPAWQMHLRVCRAVCIICRHAAKTKDLSWDNTHCRNAGSALIFCADYARVPRAADPDLDTETFLVHCQGFIWLILVIKHRCNAA